MGIRGSLGSLRADAAGRRSHLVKVSLVLTIVFTVARSFAEREGQWWVLIEIEPFVVLGIGRDRERSLPLHAATQQSCSSV